MKNKKGKKLVVLGAMAALLTLIGVSGSQTYAKYVESTKVDAEQATVAKWGFTMNSQGDLFGTKYVKDGDTKLSKIDEDASTGLTIAAGAQVVAPGAKGSMKIEIDGQAEVHTRLSFSGADTITDIYLKDNNGGSYYPISWTVSGHVKIDSHTITIDETGTLEACISAFNDKDHFINPNQVLDVDIELSWTWAYENNSQPCSVKYGNETISTDVADTFLGIRGSTESGKVDKYDYATIRGAEYEAVLTVGFSALDVSLTQVQYDEPSQN